MFVVRLFFEISLRYNPESENHSHRRRELRVFMQRVFIYGRRKGILYQTPASALTSYHKLGSLNRNVFCSSAGQKSEMEVPSGPRYLQGPGGGPSLASPSFWGSRFLGFLCVLHPLPPSSRHCLFRASLRVQSPSFLSG